MMNLFSRIARSLRSRAFYGYCDLLRWLKLDLAKLNQWEPVDLSLPTLVAIVYDRDVPLLVKSLQSLARNNPVLPPLVLIGDSDAAFALLKERVPAKLANVSLRHWEEELATLRPEEQRFVRDWLNSGKFGGYAKKFAITLATSRRTAILLSDADIIWSGPLLVRPETKAAFNSHIIVGKDYTRSYDAELAALLQEQKIMAEPPINCGFVYYPQGVFDRVLTPADYERLAQWSRRATCHFEQTLIAFVFWRTDGKFFGPDEVVTAISDDFCYRKKIQGAVRHYAGCKHLFWRDV
jgi:hypothetical protein